MYAANFANHFGGSLALLHVVHIPVVDLNASPSVLDELLQINIASANDKLAALKNQIEMQYDIKVDTSVEVGMAVSEIRTTATEISADLVIMGTHGVSNVLEKMLGSVTEAAVKEVEHPVLVIPTDISFQRLENVVLTDDYKENLDKELDFLSALAAKSPFVLHKVSVEIDSKYEYQTEKIDEDKAIVIASVFSDSVANGVMRYVQENNVQLIAMKQHERNFFQAMFQKSTTKVFLNAPTTPMLIF